MTVSTLENLGHLGLMLVRPAYLSNELACLAHFIIKLACPAHLCFKLTLHAYLGI